MLSSPLQIYSNINHFTINSILVIINFTEPIDSKTNFLTIEPNIQLQIEIVVYNSKIDFYSQI
jgi:hypothetical protein